MNKGVFITFEGGEGTGKTTQIRLLKETLEAKGYEVVTTREPGGTPEAEKIRNLLVQRDGGNWTPMAESLLLFAGRTMHIETLIKPALAEGKIVISDRFTDSTRAYQSAGHGLSLDIVEKLSTLSIDDFSPDLTLILDLPVTVGLERSGRRLARENSDEDKFENLDLSFHEKLRDGYLKIAKMHNKRCCVIDATKSIKDVSVAIQNAVLPFISEMK